MKKQNFSNLDPKLIIDNKSFWKSATPLFSDKITVQEIIKQSENEEILSSDTEIAETFNDYFSNVIQNLNIPSESALLKDGSLHKFSIGSSGEIQTLSKYHFYQ